MSSKKLKKSYFICFFQERCINFKQKKHRIAKWGCYKTSKNESNSLFLLFEQKVGKISKSDIANTCPDISISMIERTLKEMLDKGEITKVGSGRATSYVTLSVTQFE